MDNSCKHKVMPDFDKLCHQVLSLIDILKSVHKVRAENTNLPDSVFVQEIRDWEAKLRNTFGLLYVQLPFMLDVAERKAVIALKENVREVMPEYIGGLKPDYGLEATPQNLPANW